MRIAANLRLALTAAAIAAALACTGSAVAATDGGRCASAKLKSSGKSVAANLACWSRSARRGEQPDASCIERAEGKLAFRRAEVRGGCVTTGDVSTAYLAIASLVEDLVAMLQVGPGGAGIADDGARTCAGDKLLAASRIASRELFCHARARLSDSTVDAECIATAVQGYDAAWSAAEADGACGTTGDAATVRARIEEFVTSLADALPGTTTTTTTTLPPCGNELAPQCNGSCPEGSRCRIPTDVTRDVCVCVDEPVCHGVVGGGCEGNCGDGAVCFAYRGACVCL